MTANHDLPVERVRRTLRLIEHIHRTEKDRAVCLAAASTGFRELLGASVVIVAQVREDDAARLIEIGSEGWRDDSCRTLLLSTDPAGHASAPPIVGLADPTRAVVSARRCDLMADADWNVHPHLIMRCRPSGLDEFMASSVALATRPGYRGVLMLYRDISAPRFTEGDRELLHALNSECGARFWNAIIAGTTPAVTVRSLDGLIATANPAPVHTRGALLDRLTPAQRAVLPYLLEGKTEAQIGKLIYRSRYTVHDHARAIYLAMGVRNRVELVLLFNRAPDAMAGSVAQ